MARITEALVRKRAEHNEGLISTLEELALHQQNLERIELLGQICPHLKILYLQNNLIGKLQNLHKLKELEYLNVAVNNITKIQNLQRCESLKKLDMTVNFVGKAGLLTAKSLVANVHLTELYLMGNPCAEWPGYRQYIVASIPQLKKLDGHDIKPSERIAALQVLGDLQAQIEQELWAEGIDPAKAAEIEDDSIYDENGEVKETGYVDENGEMKRPWCPATRLLDHREQEQMNREADEKKKPTQSDLFKPMAPPPRHETFPEIKEGERVFQKNEGKWDFTLQESEDGASVVLDVDVGKFLDTSLIQADVQPTYVRLLIKGRLLQLVVPCEVCPDRSIAQRAKLTGHLVVTMPKQNPAEAATDVQYIRPDTTGTSTTNGQNHDRTSKGAAARSSADVLKPRNGQSTRTTKPQPTSIHNIVRREGDDGGFIIKEIRKAAVVAADPDDDDFIPDL